MNNYCLRCEKCNKVIGVMLSKIEINLDSKVVKTLCSDCFVKETDDGCAKMEDRRC